jgi:hypothetical protein
MSKFGLPKSTEIVRRGCEKNIFTFFYVKKDGFYHFFGIGSKMSIATRRWCGPEKNENVECWSALIWIESSVFDSQVKGEYD